MILWWKKKKNHNTYILSASLLCIAAWMPVRGCENPHPLTGTGQTALCLNKQDLRTISSPSQVGLGSASGSTVVSTVVTNSHTETSVSVRGERNGSWARRKLILTQLLLRERGRWTSRAMASGILLQCEWQRTAFAWGWDYWDHDSSCHYTST